MDGWNFLFQYLWGFGWGFGTLWIFAIVTFFVLSYWGAPLWLWTLSLGVLLHLGGVSTLIWGLYGFGVLFFNTPLRRILSFGVLWIFKRFSLIPKISDTERKALDAGLVWIEADLFSGRPRFQKILKEEYPSLGGEERKVIDEKLNRLLPLVDDWKLWQTREYPPEVLQCIKDEKLFGMIIPKEYGGLGFSALAHGEVIARLTTHSASLGILVMVPNSLGPAELLHNYGTEEQKRKYLPRLASGEEIPCFALTEPHAGSDAGSIRSQGVVFKGDDGRLYVRLNWNKRWITLASISTLLGVAFRLRDPENFLGQGEDVGITCALVPTQTPGVIVGRRHDPLGVPFYNCPTQGENVEVPLEDVVVGGVEGCGKGWGMLMECLTAGRGISLPSQSEGSGHLAIRAVSAHTTNRKQFGLSIGRFEGVQEALTHIVGLSYAVESCRRFTAGSIDRGQKSPVITAIAKHYCTEMMREMVNLSMDVLGGAGISRGPRNIMAHPYICAPIAITVEGANIMTRTLIIFGQGALRAHPYAYKEVAAVEKNNLKDFDCFFWKHMGHILSSFSRTVVLGLTRGFFVKTPGGPARRVYQKLTWVSSAFALFTDLAMGTLGGRLKTRGRLTGRFADILSWMYLLTCVLRRFEAEGRKKEDWPVVDYITRYGLNEIQKAFEFIFQNLSIPGLSLLLKGPISWWSRWNSLTSALPDSLYSQVAGNIQKEGPQRDRFTELVGDPSQTGHGSLDLLDQSFRAVHQAQGIELKIRKAMRKAVLPKKPIKDILDLALEKSVISLEERELIDRAEKLRDRAIQVDDFSQEEYVARSV